MKNINDKLNNFSLNHEIILVSFAWVDFCLYHITKYHNNEKLTTRKHKN